MDKHEPKRAAADGVTLSIGGMTCSGCANSVRRALSSVAGVSRADVDLARGQARVTGDARPEDLLAAVRAAGYGAELAGNVARGAQHEQGRSGGCC